MKIKIDLSFFWCKVVRKIHLQPYSWEKILKKGQKNSTGNRLFLKMGPTDEFQTNFSEFSIQFGYRNWKTSNTFFSITQILILFTVFQERKKSPFKKYSLFLEKTHLEENWQIEVKPMEWKLFHLEKEDEEKPNEQASFYGVFQTPISSITAKKTIFQP